MNSNPPPDSYSPAAKRGIFRRTSPPLHRTERGPGDEVSPDVRTDWQGIVLVAIGAFCFSLAIPFVRWTHGLNTTTIAFFRALFGFLFLSTLLTRFRAPLHFAAYRSSVRTLIVLGAFTTMTVTLYTYAVQHTTAANAALLVNSSPIYVAVLAPTFLKEPRARYTWLSLALAIVGTVCVSNPAKLRLEPESLSGILTAAASGLTYAFVLMISRKLRGQVDGYTQTLWTNGLIALALLPWAVQSSGPVVIDNLPTLIPLGVFSLGLSYLLYFQGLQRISVQVVSVVALFEPVSGALIGMIFFAEIPNLLGWAGGVLILVSIYLISR